MPPQWYLDFLATGTTQCAPPFSWCSFYEFTIVGRERFGRGAITQRITLPAGSAFPEARVNATGARHCPASAWSCTKSGDGFTCTTADCGLSPGDKVVVRIEGKVAPNMTETLSAPVEKTACGELDARPIAGRGPATILQSDDPRLKLIGAIEARRQAAESSAAGGTPGQLGQTSKKACWSIVLLPKEKPSTATCAQNYAATSDGQCCLRSQMTSAGTCCPAGQTPDARGAACVCTGGRTRAGTDCVCPPGTVAMGRQCVSREFGTVTPWVPLTPSDKSCPRGYGPAKDGQCCLRGQLTGSGTCCPPGLKPDARGTGCACSGGRTWTGTACACPPGTFEQGRECVTRGSGTGPGGPSVTCGPDQSGTPPHCCPLGQTWDGRHCISSAAAPPVRVCGPGQTGVWPHCCPPGQTWDGRRCVPSAVTPPVRVCGPGQTGDWPHCCPAGQAWNGRHCVSRSTGPCPRGMQGTPPNCRPIFERHCPRGMRGTPPHCRPIVERHCPRGMQGTPPNCRPIVERHCPRGMQGTPPHCRPIVERHCPGGMRGTPPNCRPIFERHCPRGMQGTPPNCRPIFERHCPRGMRGIPPHCELVQTPRQIRLEHRIIRPDQRRPGASGQYSPRGP